MYPQANEYSHTFPKGPASHGVLSFHSNMLPSNNPCEDSRSSATFLPAPGGTLFAVFDGHTGPACAQAISQRLFYYITMAMLPLKMLEELEWAVENERAVPQLLEWHKHPQDHSFQDGGSISFHSLRNFWQERLEDGEDQEVIRHRAPRTKTTKCVKYTPSVNLDTKESFFMSVPVTFLSTAAQLKHLGLTILVFQLSLLSY